MPALRERIKGRSIFNILTSMTTQRTAAFAYRVEACPVKPGCICDAADGAPLLQPWVSLADTAFCLCLEDRDDRFLESAAQFHENGLCTVVKYIRSRREDQRAAAAQKGYFDKQASEFGCYEAHRIGALLATAAHKNRVLFFEDDVIFNANARSGLPEVARHLNDVLGETEWDVYFLGMVPVHGEPTQSTSLWRVKALCTHAYAANRGFLDLLIANPFANQPIDQFIKERCVQYAHIPIIAVQSGVESDIDHRWPGFSRRLTGNVMQKFPVLLEAPMHARRYRSAILLLLILLLVLPLVVRALKPKTETPPLD